LARILVFLLQREGLAVSKLFLSYRRADSQDVSGRIYDDLRTSFSPQHVFKDTDSIGGGGDFRQSISDSVSQSRLMLVIIGPLWLKTADATGKPRLYSNEQVSKRWRVSWTVLN
jgi:hypothetical protein